MRWRSFVLALALMPAAAGAVTNADRLREVEAARALAEKQAARYAGQARLIEDRAQKAEARANRLAAQVTEAEARFEAAQIRASIADTRLAVLRDDLARRRAPLSRMIAALQRLARRPTLLLVMRPSSIRDFVRMRSMVAGIQPQIASRTEDLRKNLATARALAAEADRARAEGHKARTDLALRRKALLELGARHQVTARELAKAAGNAQREATLRGAQAASIGELVAEERAGSQTLAALTALPVPNLLGPGTASGAAQGKAQGTGGRATDSASVPHVPVAGRILAGYGERDAAGGRSRGITIAPEPAAMVVAPLAGEVAFAGPFRGYGTVVILRHAGGRTSLIAGLDGAKVAPGHRVRRGETIGSAPRSDPAILYELRRGRRTIHPLKP